MYYQIFNNVGILISKLNSQIKGPLVRFGPPEKNSFYVLHYNGFIYEVNFTEGGILGEADTTLMSSNPANGSTAMSGSGGSMRI